MTAILVPLLILIMMMVKRHYVRVKRETADPTPLRLTGLEQPIVVIPMARWDKITEKAMRFGMTMSNEVKVLHVDSEEADALGCVWQEFVLAPIHEAKMAEPELVTVKSNYRTVLSPLMDYVLKLEEDNPGRKIAVLLPNTCRAPLVGEPCCTASACSYWNVSAAVEGQSAVLFSNIPWYL